MITLKEWLEESEYIRNMKKGGFRTSSNILRRMVMEGEEKSPELKEYLERMGNTPEAKERKKARKREMEAFMNSPEVMELRRELEQERKK